MCWHKWSKWEVISEHRGTVSGWPCLTIFQRRKCAKCQFIELDKQEIY